MVGVFLVYPHHQKNSKIPSGLSSLVSDNHGMSSTRIRCPGYEDVLDTEEEFDQVAENV